MRARLLETVYDRANTLDVHFPFNREKKAYFIPKKISIAVTIEADGTHGILVT